MPQKYFIYVETEREDRMETLGNLVKFFICQNIVREDDRRER